MTHFVKGDRVVIRDLNFVGVIDNVRLDDRGDPIYTVALDDASQTSDGLGLFVARDCELKAECGHFSRFGDAGQHCENCGAYFGEGQ